MATQIPLFFMDAVLLDADMGDTGAHSEYATCFGPHPPSPFGGDMRTYGAGVAFCGGYVVHGLGLYTDTTELLWADSTYSSVGYYAEVWGASGAAPSTSIRQRQTFLR